MWHLGVIVKNEIICFSKLGQDLGERTPLKVNNGGIELLYQTSETIFQNDTYLY